MFDFSIFATPEAWISLVTLTFLEIVLGIDNLVFIAITTNRLPEEKQHIGRRLGLAGAMIMRCLLLCFAAYLVHMTDSIIVVDAVQIHGEAFGLSIRDLVLIGGGVYLLYKGIVELRDKLKLVEERREAGHHEAEFKMIGLGKAIVTIMVMDMVFSLDSVFTAVGLSGQLLIMIPAVIVAVCMMIIFADPISEFINEHAEMKILALVFISVIGVLLICEGLELVSGIELLGMGLENLMVYFAMLFAVILEFVQMRYNKNLARMHREIEEHRREQEVAADSSDDAEFADDVKSDNA